MVNLSRGVATAEDFATFSFRLGVKFVSILACTLYFVFLNFRSILGLAILLVTLAVSDSSLKMSCGGC